jgi:hypothetical protein
MYPLILATKMSLASFWTLFTNSLDPTGLFRWMKTLCRIRSRVARWFIFKQKYQIGYILGGLGMENAGIYLTIWNILRPFGKFYGSLV